MVTARCVHTHVLRDIDVHVHINVDIDVYVHVQAGRIREELTVAMVTSLRQIADKASENSRRRRLSVRRHGSQFELAQLKTMSSPKVHLEVMDGLENLSAADHDLIAAMCAAVSNAATVTSFDPASAAQLLFPIARGSRSRSLQNLLSGSVANSGTTAEQRSTEREQQVRAMMESEEVTPMFEPEAMRLWARWLLHDSNMQTNENLALFTTINVAVRKFVADSSSLSEYAHNEEAHLYRRLVSVYPYVLDALIDCSEEEAQRFSTVIKWIEGARKTYGGQGLMSRFVVRLDRGAFACFLAEHADEYIRRSLGTLMQQIVSALRNDSSASTAHGQCFLGRFRPFVFIDPAAADR